MRFFILMLLVVASLYAEVTQIGDTKVVPRPDIDPAIQGLWHADQISTDGGKTFKQYRPPVLFARVGALKVTLADGTVMKASDVVIVEQKDKPVENWIYMKNGNMMTVSKPFPGKNILIVVVYIKDEIGDYCEQSRSSVLLK